MLSRAFIRKYILYCFDHLLLLYFIRLAASIRLTELILFSSSSLYRFM